MTIYTRFIAGHNIKSAIRTFKSWDKWIPIVDYAKEASANNQQALRYMDKLGADLRVLNETGMKYALALKLSSFGPLSITKFVESIDNKATLFLDAEDNSRHHVEQAVFNDLIKRHSSSGRRIYKTYQMYRRDALDQLQRDIDMLGPSLCVKLVRGAYPHLDKHVMHPSKELTDRAYNRAIEVVVEKNIRTVVATHNIESIQVARKYGANIAFAQLMGFRDKLSSDLANEGFEVYKYAPYGPITETWPYLLRRLYEVRSNGGFFSPRN